MGDALGLRSTSWWTGNHGVIVAGCSWRDADHDNAHFNHWTSTGQPRADLHPICKRISRKPTPRYTPAPEKPLFHASKAFTENRTRYTGNVVTTHTSERNWMCADFCERDSRCLSWTWRNEVCYILADYIPWPESRTGEYSGVPKRNGSDEDYLCAGKQYCRGFKGKVLASREHRYFESEPACRTLCDNTFTCTGYHWLPTDKPWQVPQRNKCTIYTSPETWNYHQHMVRTVSKSGKQVGRCYAKRNNAGGTCGWWYSCDGFKDTRSGGRRLMDGEQFADRDYTDINGPEEAADTAKKPL